MTAVALGPTPGRKRVKGPFQLFRVKTCAEFAMPVLPACARTIVMHVKDLMSTFRLLREALTADGVEIRVAE